MSEQKEKPYSRRQVVGGLGSGVAAAVDAPAFSRASEAPHSTDRKTAQPIQNPTRKYPEPPFEKQSQPWPVSPAK